MKKYYPGLNVIRAISAILIMLFHYTTMYNQSIYTPENLKTSYPVTFPWGSMAVISFFLLSGFLTEINSEESALKYLGKRFIRLYPAFFVAVILTSVVTFLFYKPAFVGIEAILVNFTMLPSLFGVSAVDGVYWTLVYEIKFYIIVAILLAIRKLKLNNVLVLLWAIVSLMAGIFKDLLSGTLIGSGIEFFLFPKYSTTFLLGIALREVSKNKKNIISYFTAVVSVVGHYFSLGLSSMIWAMVVAVIIVYVSIINPKTVLNKDNVFTKACSFLASISYALYLVHQNIGYAIIRGLVTCGLTNEVFVLIPIAVSILIAYLIFRFVETPISKRLKGERKNAKQ